MLARRLTTILPAMTFAEASETTRIPRIAGLTGDCALTVPLPDHISRSRVTVPLQQPSCAELLIDGQSCTWHRHARAA
jgi:hypothetical protein